MVGFYVSGGFVFFRLYICIFSFLCVSLCSDVPSSLCHVLVCDCGFFRCFNILKVLWPNDLANFHINILKAIDDPYILIISYHIIDDTIHFYQKYLTCVFICISFTQISLKWVCYIYLHLYHLLKWTTHT